MKKLLRRNLRWYVLLLIIIIVIGLLPRAVEILSGNYLFGYDMGLFLEKVKRIVVDHTFTLIGEEVGGREDFFRDRGFIIFWLSHFSYLVVIRMAG